MYQVSPVLAGLVFLSAGAGAEAASAVKAMPPSSDSFDVHYAISLIGLPLGSARISGTLGPSSYKFEASGRLTGLAGVIVNTKGAATATGSVANGRLTPATFAATAANPSYVLTIRMAMANGAATAVEITPPYDQRPDRIPLTEADKRGIIDPLSSFVMPVAGSGDLIGPAACDRKLPLFDGGVRFDVTLAYVGRREVATPAYTGPVAVCSARYRPIAGYRPDRPVTKFMTANKEMEVWLAPLGKSRYVAPYRISVLSMLGTTLIEATGLTVASAGKPSAPPQAEGQPAPAAQTPETAPPEPAK